MRSLAAFVPITCRALRGEVSMYNLLWRRPLRQPREVVRRSPPAALRVADDAVGATPKLRRGGKL